MDKIIDILIKSSADPKKTSLTLKSLGLAAIPAILWATGTLDALGYNVTYINASLLQEAFNYLSEAVRYIFIGINFVILASGAIGTAYGFIRKFYKTIKGINPVSNAGH